MFKYANDGCVICCSKDAWLFWQETNIICCSHKAHIHMLSYHELNIMRTHCAPHNAPYCGNGPSRLTAALSILSFREHDPWKQRPGHLCLSHIALPVTGHWSVCQGMCPMAPSMRPRVCVCSVTDSSLMTNDWPRPPWARQTILHISQGIKHPKMSFISCWTGGFSCSVEVLEISKVGIKMNFLVVVWF